MKMHLRNGNTEPISTIFVAATILFGTALLAPISIGPAHADTQAIGGRPQFLLDWEGTHPGYSGCLSLNMTEQSVAEVTCDFAAIPIGMHNTNDLSPQTSSIKPDTTIYSSKTLDCSSNCWAGAEFYNYGPFDNTEAYLPIPSAPSSTPDKFDGWVGLTNCNYSGSTCTTTQLLAQGGWAYGSVYNGTSPDQFVELWGNFDLNGNSCTSTFCGYLVKEYAGDQLYNADGLVTGANGYWFAYIQDNGPSGSGSYEVQDSLTNVGISSNVAYILPSIEMYGATSNSYITTPVDFDNVTAFASYPTVVDIDPSVALNYVGPTAGSGVSISSYTASYSCGSCLYANMVVN